MSSDVRDRLELLKGGGLQPDGLVAMARDGDAVVGESELPGIGQLEFEATLIRAERTGTHAKVKISCGDRRAAHSVLNVDRDEDRTRLANSAGKRIGGEKRGDAVKVRLDEFCDGLWTTWVRTDEGSVIPLSGGTPPTWLLEPYILRDAGTILFAAPGQAKSWTALIWATLLTSGPCPASPFSCGQARVVFVNLERSEASVSWRLGQVAGALDLRPKVIGMHHRGRKFSDVEDAVRATVRREGADLVIIDSLSRTGYGSLTLDDDSNRAMDAMNSLGCGWVVLAHSPRADASHVFGSVMFDAAADLCVRLESAYAPGSSTRLGVKLEPTKANDVRKAPAAFFEYGFGPQTSDGVVSIGRANPGDFPDLAPPTSVADQVAEALTAGAASATSLAKELDLDPAAVRQALHRDSRFVRLDRAGRTVLYGLVTHG